MPFLSRSEPEAAWVAPFTIADATRIEALDQETRALVERYVRSRGFEPVGDNKKLIDLIADEVETRVDIRRDVERGVCAALQQAGMM